MLIPLWLPWVVLAAAVAIALLSRDSQAHWGRDLGRWVVVLIALIVAVSLTVDQRQVQEDELIVAVRPVMHSVDGTAGELSSDRLKVLVEDRLGHEVEVEEIEDDDEDQAQVTFEVRVGDDASVCVSAYEKASESGIPLLTSFGVNSGTCP